MGFTGIKGGLGNRLAQLPGVERHLGDIDAVGRRP